VEVEGTGKIFCPGLYPNQIYPVGNAMSSSPKALAAAPSEPLLFRFLTEGEMYGCEILQRVESLSEEEIRRTNSKPYPLLHHLQNEGLAEAAWYASESSPDRKYYRPQRPGGRGAARCEAAGPGCEALVFGGTPPRDGGTFGVHPGKSSPLSL
jgi:hypothetical protein